MLSFSFFSASGNANGETAARGALASGEVGVGFDSDWACDQNGLASGLSLAGEFAGAGAVNEGGVCAAVVGCRASEKGEGTLPAVGGAAGAAALPGAPPKMGGSSGGAGVDSGATAENGEGAAPSADGAGVATAENGLAPGTAAGPGIDVVAEGAFSAGSKGETAFAAPS
ncbi:MAG: hypothetical protein AAGA58_01550 [Verrucomicrobiota bacterium]